MRSIPLAGGLMLVLAFAGRAAADPVPYNATVTAATADVRSGPSSDSKFYATNRLQRGTVVQVLRERPDGWLEIRPPDGSFSWINESFVKQMIASQPNNLVVDCRPGEKVEVRIGSELVDTKPTVIGAHLERSTQVHLFQRPGHVTRPQSDTDGTWLPIEPPAAEVRYLRTDAVAKPVAPTTMAARPPTADAPAAVPLAGPATSSFTAAPLPATTPAAPGDKPTHAEVEELYNKAVMVERSGNVPQAIQLYAKAGSLGLTINSPVAPQAIARANYLLGAAPPGTAPVVDSRFSPVSTEPTVHLARPSPGSAVPAGATFSVSRQTGTAVAGLQFIGQLRRSGRGRFNRPTYVLEAERGPLLYANPSTGVDLEPYVGRNVELLGTAAYDGELRANYMVVTQVRLVQ
jgi:SH3-like domain-containing protein